MKNGRGGEIRTHDLLYPKQARYQATLRPDPRAEEGAGTRAKLQCRNSKIRFPHVFSARMKPASPIPVLVVTDSHARAYLSLKHATVTAD